ncbi:glycerol-3-phosphate acyltransferase 3-like [Ruditapes philippinarum]|uniref:glycerol-3-phosphate acyltransferase 3-like n=1 Tax=Ruditapes philippinarum TaxID=129788 RepID=UPI00295AA099|nr:glycerol-3-phosphate acyltransferase 3-like [Ruditapes philippinarum]
MENLIIIAVLALFYFLFGIIVLTIVLAAAGQSLGIRRKYIQILLKVFEFGRRRINSYAASERDKQKHLHKEEEGSGDEGLPEADSLSDTSQESENHVFTGNDQVIYRDISISALEGIKIPSKRPDYDLTFKKDFHVSDIMYFVKCGVEAIIQDDVTHRFTAEDLKSWNFLTRTDKGYQFISMRLTILWWIGCLVRYGILLPFRFTLCTAGLLWLISSTFLIGYIPDGKQKRFLNRISSLMAHRILCRAMSAVVTFNYLEHRPRSGICVANHTSPLDVVILSSDNCYAMVGQSHSGFLGIMQRALSRATSHIWFERSEIKDRLVVSKRMQEHVEDQHKLPILIFPEGTCINNTSVMMFKKGGFEVSPVVYPVAVKYDSRFGDAFWNSSKDSMIFHIFRIMTSWALVVDVWYLPPMKRLDGEDSVSFASRVKAEIAIQGGLVDLEWDGQLKRMKAKETWKSSSQRDYSKLLKVE